MKPPKKLLSIAETATWTAYSRVIESQRSDFHFRDPYASVLIEACENKAFIASLGAKSASIVSVRTCIIDQFLLRCISEGVDTVVNLAAGYDTRPYPERLGRALPPQLKWIEVDQPNVLAHKKLYLSEHEPSCHLERVPLDLLDAAKLNDFLASVSRKSCSTVVISEGLLVYLSEQQVNSLSAALREASSVHTWIFDFVCPLILKSFAASCNSHLAQNGQVRFAPLNGLGYFQQRQWDLADYASFLEQAHTLNREVLWMKLLRYIRPYFGGSPNLKSLYQNYGVCLLKSTKIS